MLLANVYMMLGDHSNAIAPLRDVINSGLFSLTANEDLALNSAFNKLRATDDLPEVIYAREFDASISNTGNLPVHALMVTLRHSLLRLLLKTNIPYG